MRQLRLGESKAIRSHSKGWKKPVGGGGGSPVLLFLGPKFFSFSCHLENQ